MIRSSGLEASNHDPADNLNTAGIHVASTAAKRRWFFRDHPPRRGARRLSPTTRFLSAAYNSAKEAIMNEDVFNASIRKFLKILGVSAQREIEKAVRQALAQDKLKGNEKFSATGTVTVGGIGLSHEVKGEIELE
jgi:Family of unknown function (DUF6494)